MPSPPTQRQEDGSMPWPSHPLLLQIRLLVDRGAHCRKLLGFWDGATGCNGGACTRVYESGFQAGVRWRGRGCSRNASRTHRIAR